VIDGFYNHSSFKRKDIQLPEILEIQDAPVFSYVLASADMRYIEIGEREIYLRHDPEAGLVFRGAIWNS